MLKALCRTIFKAQGWTLMGEEFADYPRCVVVAGPHTSNWDTIFTIAAFDMLNLPVRFAIKKEWMRFPLNLIVEPLGGIGVDRRPREITGERPSMVEAMSQLFEEHPEELALVITPEGTRSLSTRWRSGFYHVAMNANVPIVVCYLDYAKREAGVGKILYPSGDFEADMRKITAFYTDITPKFPEKFSVDLRFIESPEDETASA